jgi:hypothetical protein
VIERGSRRSIVETYARQTIYTTLIHASQLLRTQNDLQGRSKDGDRLFFCPSPRSTIRPYERNSRDRDLRTTKAVLRAMKLDFSRLDVPGAKLASNARHAIFRNLEYSCQIGKRENKILNNVRLFLQNLLLLLVSTIPSQTRTPYSSTSSS